MWKPVIYFTPLLITFSMFCSVYSMVFHCIHMMESLELEDKSKSKSKVSKHNITWYGLILSTKEVTHHSGVRHISKPLINTTQLSLKAFLYPVILLYRSLDRKWSPDHFAELMWLIINSLSETSKLLLPTLEYRRVVIRIHSLLQDDSVKLLDTERKII